YELVPIILYFEGHALAAVSLTHEFRNADDHRRYLYDALAKNEPGKFFSDKALFLAAISGDKPKYLAVECTGFAVGKTLPAPAGHERNEEGRLSFEAALAAGRDALGAAGPRLLYAIDVSIAWKAWRIRPAPNVPAGHNPQLSTPWTHRRSFFFG